MTRSGRIAFAIFVPAVQKSHRFDTVPHTVDLAAMLASRQRLADQSHIGRIVIHDEEIRRRSS